MKPTEQTKCTTAASLNVTANTPAIPADIYTSLKSQCDALGISLSKLCREADVDRSVIERWRRSEPKSIRTYNALVEALEKLKTSNQ